MNTFGCRVGARHDIVLPSHRRYSRVSQCVKVFSRTVVSSKAGMTYVVHINQYIRSKIYLCKFS